VLSLLVYFSSDPANHQSEFKFLGKKAVLYFCSVLMPIRINFFKLRTMCRAAYTYHSVRHSVVERRGTSDSLVGKTSLQSRASATTNGTPPLRPSAGGGGRGVGGSGNPPLGDGTRLSVPRSPLVNGQRRALQQLEQKETVFAN